MRKYLKLRNVVLSIVVLLLLATGAFVAWANNPLPAAPEALAALQSTTEVSVQSQNGWTVFAPTGSPPTTGFIFYPGGRVDPRAYALHLQSIARNGYLVVLTPMPLNLAVFGVNEASEVIQNFPDIKLWAVGGHSLGGAMAARYVQSNPDSVQGLVFWASYPDIDLSSIAIKALSVYGTNDSVANAQGIQNSAAMLPPDTIFVAVDGGNHSGFGWYGLQPGDTEASITPADQTDQTVDATSTLLASLSD